MCTVTGMVADTPQSERDIWFPAKRYGWGWGLPCRREGWIFLAVWMAVLMAGTAGLLALLAWPISIGAWFVIFYGWMTLWTTVLIAVCWAKGERPRWR